MENNNQKEFQAIKKEKSIKWKVYFIIAVIFVGFGAYGYYWYQQTNILRIEAQSVVNKAMKYDILSDTVNAENDRCEKFIANKEGDFGSFEYCKKFIDLVDNLQITE